MLTDKITLFDGEHIEDLGEDIGVVVSKQHTFGTDAMLLASFANPRPNDNACDFGTEVHAFGESMFYYMTEQYDKILPECKHKFVDNRPHPTNPQEEAIVKFWDDLPESIVPVLAETKVFNRNGTPYAGTFDILFYYFWIFS